MRTLTENQKTFLLEKFFKNEKHVGWRNIATNLLENEDNSCIVAGLGCIWVGGVGNFIKTETAKDLIGCSKYTLDLDSLISSKWFQEVFNDYVMSYIEKEKLLKQQIELLNQEYREIFNIDVK